MEERAAFCIRAGPEVCNQQRDMQHRPTSKDGGALTRPAKRVGSAPEAPAVDSTHVHESIL